MIRRFGTADLADALTAAAAALDGSPETWQLPTATIDPLELDLHGANLTIQGGVITGELRLRGAARLVLERVRADRIDVEADTVALEAGGGTLRIRARTANVVDHQGRADLEATELLRVVRLRAGADVRLAAGELELGDIVVTSGVLQAVSSGSLVAVGITVRGVTLPGAGAGIELVGQGVVLRGFTVRDVTAVGQVAGVLVRCAAGAVVEVGSVSEVRGATGAAIRIEATPSLEGVRVREVAIAEVRGATSGIVIEALVEETDPVWRDGEPGAVIVEDLVVERVASRSLSIEGGLRNIEVVRAELWVGGGVRLDGDRVLVAATSLVDQSEPVEVGPAELWLVGVLALRAGSPPVRGGAGGVLARAEQVYADAAAWPWRPFLAPPFEAAPGIDLTLLVAGDLPPWVPHDLQVHPDYRRLAVSVPAEVREDGGSVLVSVGARPASLPPICTSTDPEARPIDPATPPSAEDPVIDYRVHDYEGLLATMKARWAELEPESAELPAADLGTALLELQAHELDRIAWLQEAHAAERTLVGARRRRSVEDHARTLDYTPDHGLSATALLRVRLDLATVDRIAAAPAAREEPLAAHLVAAGLVGLVLPKGTVVANGPFDAWATAFSTEDDLRFDAILDDLRLEADVPQGATEALVSGTLPQLVGRWFLLESPAGDRHVGRVTQVELATSTTLLRWDPRRPTRTSFPRMAPSRIDGEPLPSVLCANLVVASHALWLEPGVSGPFAAWTRDLLVNLPDGAAVREVVVPFSPIARVAPGWPLPGVVDRVGQPLISVAVDGDPWRLVDDLSVSAQDQEVFVLRSGHDGRAVVRFGDGVNGAPLPEGPVTLSLSVGLGLGTIGNVGADALTRILAFGATPPEEVPLALRVGADGSADVEERLRQLIRVTNPLPAMGGRDPEGIERIRRRAPVLLWTPRTAVTADDCAALVAELPEVAGARADTVLGGLRPLVRVTVLLRDEDSLVEDEVLRRWAVVRQRLESIRICGIEVESVPPSWVSLDLDISVDAEPHASAVEVDRAVRAALAGAGGLFDPDRSGLGGDVHLSDIYRVVAGVPGVSAARVTRLRRWVAGAPTGGVLPISGTTRTSVAPPQRDWLEDGVLPVGAHEVATLRRLGRGEGLLTVTVCGGLR